MRVHRFPVLSCFCLHSALACLFLPAVFLGTASTALHADVTLPSIFGDHMVLQRDGVAPIWGTAAPGETVTVTAGTVHETVTAGQNGTWKVHLKDLPVSSQPIDLTVQGKNTLAFHDVLVGDVWVCSGQSNMEFGVFAPLTGAQEPPTTPQPQIRLFCVPKGTSPIPSSSFAAPASDKPLHGSWQVCTPDTLAKDGAWMGFSAVGYYFGREIQAFTGAPVGLIGAYWGGISAASWTSEESLAAVPSLQPLADKAADVRENYDRLVTYYKTVQEPQWEEVSKKWKEKNKDALDAYAASLRTWQAAVRQGGLVPPEPVPPKAPPQPSDPSLDPHRPASLYNGMVAPFVSYGIKGVIWYQGEQDVGDPVGYRTLFPTLIGDWRKQWGQGDFPFLFVQLPNMEPLTTDPNKSGWAGLREAQSLALALPNTGMAVAIDIGETSTIHPPDKFDVAHRLALTAEHVAYGTPGGYSGPTFRDMTVEGGKIRVSFDHTDGGLTIGTPPEHFHPGHPREPHNTLTGFAVAGKDGNFVWADATINGETVVVSSPQVSEPVSVRYGWVTSPDCNLYNGQGLPAAPFRTDKPGS